MRISIAALLLLDVYSRAQNIPDSLKPPPSETLFLQVHTTGDQIYVCDGSAWTFSRPDAKLFDQADKQVGTHFAGPTWESSDGSRVIGKAAGNATPDPDSIPWLLLKATDHQGEGVLKPVTSIQRISTKGGKAPEGGCDAQHKSQEFRSHYTAVYLFYKSS